MKYQKDAHHYRKVVRKRRNSQRIKGISFIAISLALMFYAVPCFAVSVFDYGQPTDPSSTSFSDEISDYATAEESTAAAGVKAAEDAAKKSEDATDEASTAAAAPSYATSDYSLISNTTGPGALSNEAAVAAAKTRSEALAAIASGKEPSSSVTSLALFAKSATASDNDAVISKVSPTDLLFASLALITSIICAILGVRMIVRGRQIRGMQIAAAYGHALRA